MKLFYEKYIKLAHIGKGANAHVYKVRHAELGYIRAIKILNEDIESKEDRAYQSFLKECKTLLTIGNGAHPNIIRIYGPDLIDNHAIVEMDYVQGNTLDSYIKDKGFLDYEEVKTFIHDIVGALAYTHHDIYKFLMNPDDDDLQQDPKDGKKYVITPEKEAELVKKYGIAHNDLHSNNVMRRDYDGSFVLLDFGLAVQDGECIKSSRKSDGHPEYMAPEKFDSGDITPRSDVYSIGVLIYEILTGRPPFVLDYDSEGKVSYPALSKICNEHHDQTPPAILPLRKKAFERQIPGAVYERDYPEWLDEVVMKCLAKNPKDRYADAKELLKAIQNALRNSSDTISSKTNTAASQVLPEPSSAESAEDEGNVVHDIPKSRMKRKKTGMSLIFCLIVALAGGTIWWINGRDKITSNNNNEALEEVTIDVSSTTDKDSIIHTANNSEESPVPNNGNKNMPNQQITDEVPNSGISPSRTNDEPMTTLQPETSRKPKMNIPNSIQETLSTLLNKEIPREVRLNAIPSIISKFFEPNAKVKTLGESGDIIEIEDVEDFLRRIIMSRRINRINVISIEKDSKITELSVQN